MLLSLIYCHLTVTNGKGEILVSITKCISRTDDVFVDERGQGEWPALTSEGQCCCVRVHQELGQGSLREVGEVEARRKKGEAEGALGADRESHCCISMAKGGPML